ncbi:hypothetical protein [Hoeflea olei]|nr:hypothetical protein [Hoeflea olei]
MMAADKTETAKAGASAHRLVACDGPAFVDVLREAAEKLLAMHDRAPRIVRYVASMQKWLITQTIIALHFEHKLAPARPPLTATSLVGFFAERPLYSRNTLIAHLAEMRAYGLVTERRNGDGRVRPLFLSGEAEALIGQWLAAHLSALDRLDGGDSASWLAADPQRTGMVQPLAARSLLSDPGWVHPPASVDLFVRTETGSNILHDLICRLPSGAASEDRPFCLGALHASEISRRHTLSRGHVQRVFSRARAEGLLVWSQSGNRGELFVSQALIRDYTAWQARKFLAIAAACDRARGGLHPESYAGGQARAAGAIAPDRVAS